MRTMEKYNCAFEHSHKGIFLKVVPNEQYNYLDISAFVGNEHKVSVCLRDNQVDELIEELQNFRNRNKQCVQPQNELEG